MTDFSPFPKMARLMRDIVITEKIDGTNAQIFIGDDLSIRAGSRNRWITPDDDNFGFARWVADHEDELITGLGPGRHFGEWWGSGIQRGYGLENGDKAFSLFNASRWFGRHPVCCDVVPTLYEGPFDQEHIDGALEVLKERGSLASPGFMDPEGIIVWHTAANIGFKRTIKNDSVPKGSVR
jgi:hypothetical protein